MVEASISDVWLLPLRLKNKALLEMKSFIVWGTETIFSPILEK
ncbi:hypothetical protein EAFG_01227 [Escherichia coli H413]|nr:hypothetical protein EAFG_01227 [Escherichia coli H413]